MTSAGRWPYTAFSVFAGGANHPAHPPDHAPLLKPRRPALRHPPAPAPGPWSLQTQPPLWQPPSEGGARPRERAGAMDAGETEAGEVLKPAFLCLEDRSQGTVTHAQHLLSPVDTGIFFSWENTAKRPLRGLPSPPRHHWCQASRTPRDSAVLVPLVSHCCRHHTAQPAAELPKDPSPWPPLTKKMQFPPLETSGTGGGERGDVPNALLQRRVRSSSCGGLVLPLPNGVQAVKIPRGSPALSDD